MPYITQRARFELIEKGEGPHHAGELNYLITMTIVNGVRDNVQTVLVMEKIKTLVEIYIGQKGRRYKIFNEVVGVLECAKLELVRRGKLHPNSTAWATDLLDEVKKALYTTNIAPYEDKKIEENGDVY